MASKILIKRLLPWQAAVAIIALINIVSIALIVWHIDFNNAPELYFPKDAPSVQLNERLRREFPNDEFLIGVYTGSDLFSDSMLRAIHRVASEMRKQPLVDRVSDVTDIDHIAGTEDGFAVEPLIDINKLAASTPAQRKARVLADRFAPGMVVAKDGSALSIIVRTKRLEHSFQRQHLEQALYHATRDAGLEKNLVAVAGQAAVDSAELRSMLADSSALIPLTMAIGIAFLVWVVGHPAPVIIGGVAMSTVVLSTVGVLSLIGQPYTLVLAMVPPLLAAYTVATLLHVYAALARARQAGLRRPRRVLRAINDVHVSGLFNILTTGAGMASFLFTTIPPIQVFGIVGAVGTVLVYLMVFHLAPPLLVKWDRGPWPKHGGFRWTRKLAFGIAGFAMRRAGLTLAGMALLIVATIPLVAKVKVESDLLKFFPPDHSLSQSTRLVEERFSGVTTLQVVFEGQHRDDLKNVARLKAMKDFQTWVENLPEVDRTLSMMDLIEEMNWAFHGEEKQYRQIPDNDKLLSQLLLLYDGRDLNELVNRDYSRTQVLLSVNVHGAHAIDGVMDKIRQRLANHPVPGVKTDIAGFGRLFADQEELLVMGQVRSFASAFIQIFIFLAILWRSLVSAGIGLLPNLAPLYFIFVLMGAFGISLDMATSLIAAVILGITVDDTIHLYHGYQHRLQSGCSHTFALARSFEASGRAVLAVTAVLVAQFGFLMGSQFIPTKQFGMLSALGLISGQICELLLLPSLLVVYDKYRRRRAG